MTEDVARCLALWDKLWFMNMGFTDKIRLIDWENKS